MVVDLESKYVVFDERTIVPSDAEIMKMQRVIEVPAGSIPLYCKLKLPFATKESSNTKQKQIDLAFKMQKVLEN